MEQLLVSHDPHDPSRVLVERPETDAAGVARAVTAARGAFPGWAALGGVGRSQALRAVASALGARAEELADLIVHEVGKPRPEAAGEVARALSIIEYYAQVALLPLGDVLPPSAGGLLYTERRPHGAVGLITPWNFPAAIPLWKAMPALAAGNTVLVKPSTAALATAELLRDVLDVALPAGVFTLIPGEKDTATALIDLVDAVSFTGSTAVGRSVARRAAGRGIPVQAEMGGQNAAVVLPDADVEATAAMLTGAAMGYAGQKCTATRRIVVVGDDAALLEALEAAVRGVGVGDPDEDGTVVGPVISADAAAAVERAADTARAAGGEVVRGTAYDGPGHHTAPALLRGLDADHPLNRTETFGPITSVLRVGSVAEAVAVANGVDQGLVTSVHGRDLAALLDTVAGLDSGMIKVNAPTSGVDFYAPFGGEKDSSTGPREQGPGALDFYTSSRTITIASPGAPR